MHGHMTDCAELMAAYCDGDVRAFRTLHGVVAPKLQGYLSKLTRDHALAADLVQATFMKVHKSRHQYIRGADPVAWMFSIAHHAFIDETRKRTTVPLDDHDLPTPAPVEQVDQTETIEAALAALDQLSATHRQAVVLIKLEGRSVAEAAEIVGISPGAMRVRVHRGYEALRAALRPGAA